MQKLWLHICSLNSTIDLKRQNNGQKAFPAKNFVHKNKKLSIILHACTHAGNFCRQAIGFASKFTKNIRTKSKRSVKQSKESQRETANCVTLNTSMSSFSAVDYLFRVIPFRFELQKRTILINCKSRKIHLETV